MADNRKNTKGKGKPFRTKKDFANKGEVEVKYGRDYNATKCPPNDWRWYAQHEQLLKDAASFPYAVPIGNRLNLGEHGLDINKTSVPGIMAIYTSSTFGWSDNANSPLNVSARNVYSYVRHANAGHSNYDAPDLMLYLCAMDSVYSYIAYLKRIYGIAMTFSYTNRYYPVAAISAMRVDFDDIQKHLADFRSFINMLCVKAGSMCIPATMSYMAKHTWMYSGIYTDNNSDKAQSYMFCPEGFWYFDLIEQSGGLKYLSISEELANHEPDPNHLGIGPTLKFADLIKIGNTLLDPILSSEDMNIMSGDILKAFGEDMVYKLEAIDETYNIKPTYDETVLDQINNLSMIGRFVYSQPGEPYLKQDPTKGYLMFTPTFTHPFEFDSEFVSPGHNAFMCNRFVNFERGDVTPAMTMEATRMMNIADAMLDDVTYKVTTLASEVAHYAYIYLYVFRDAGSATLHDLAKHGPLYIGNTPIISVDSSVYTECVKPNLDDQGVLANRKAVVTHLKQLFKDYANTQWKANMLASELNVFHRHPPVAFTNGIEDTSTASVATGLNAGRAYSPLNGFQNDINYYTVIDAENLRNLAQVALLSMFDVTQYGRSSGK